MILRISMKCGHDPLKKLVEVTSKKLVEVTYIPHFNNTYRTISPHTLHHVYTMPYCGLLNTKYIMCSHTED